MLGIAAGDVTQNNTGQGAFTGEHTGSVKLNNLALYTWYLQLVCRKWDYSTQVYLVTKHIEFHAVFLKTHFPWNFKEPSYARISKHFLTSKLFLVPFSKIMSHFFVYENITAKTQKNHIITQQISVNGLVYETACHWDLSEK